MNVPGITVVQFHFAIEFRFFGAMICRCTIGWNTDGRRGRGRVYGEAVEVTSTDIVVAIPNIEDSVRVVRPHILLVRYSGDTAVFAGIFPQPNANIIDVIDQVQVELDKLKREMPAGLDASFGYDASQYVSDAITEVSTTLAETLLIVIIVIFKSWFTRLGI